MEQVSHVFSLSLAFLEGWIVLAVRKSSDKLQIEMKGLSPNLIQAKVTVFASILYKFFLQVSLSVISIVFNVVLCIVYSDAPEQQDFDTKKKGSVMPSSCSKHG